MKIDTHIYHHLGLGDHIICNGLVRKITQDKKNYGIFTKTHNFESVSFMYRDLKNLKVIPVQNETEISNYKDILTIGHQNLNEIMLKHGCLWDESFYKQINIDFSERWNSFYYNRDFKSEKSIYDELNPNKEKFALIHNEDSTGTERVDKTKINPELKQIFLQKRKTIFEYGFLIATATEIHCIDSSLKHLVDSLPTMGKLFYHKNFNTRTTLEHNHKKKWIII